MRKKFSIILSSIWKEIRTWFIERKAVLSFSNKAEKQLGKNNLILCWIKSSSGGGAGVECSPRDTEVLGLIPSIDCNFFTIFQSSHWFSTSVVKTLTLGTGLFYLYVFPLQLVNNTYPSLLLLLSSSSVSKLYKCSFSISIYLTLLEPSISTKLLLCGPVEQAKKSSNICFDSLVFTLSDVPAGLVVIVVEHCLTL